MLKSALAIASLATLVLGQNASESCPEYTTTTYTVTDRPSTSWVGEEVTETGKTRNLPYTDEIANYTSTATSTRTPDTHTVSVFTGTSTVIDPATATEFTNTCTSNSTLSVEYTSTKYTGTYSPSSLRQTCVPAPTSVWIYELGTVSLTPTTVIYPERTVTEYYPTVSTAWVNGTVATPTTTVTTDSLVSVAGTTTLPRKNNCFPREFTATASTATTQDARCAPSNLAAVGLIVDESSAPFMGQSDDSPALVDASACCQQCVDDENCAASYFVDLIGDPLGQCKIYNSTEAECGWGLTVTSQEEGGGKVAAAGCGFIAEQSNSWRD